MAISSASETRRAYKQGHSLDGSRLKREDHCLPTPQDTLFSPWKILVGLNDWKNHSIGVEGVERYRLHNLPATYFGPGVYELALHLDKYTYGSDSKKDALRSFRRDNIVVVYVGQAENVRTRLQHYGRCGSHLEGGLDLIQNAKPSQSDSETTLSTVVQSGPGDLERILDSSTTPEAYCHPRLFTKAFSQGYSIAFRWTAAGSKEDAAAIETGLLTLFDYAWNKGSNGKRRPCDAFKKLQQQAQRKAMSWYKPSKWNIKLPRMGASKVRNVREKRAVVTIFKDRLRKLNYLAKRVSAPDGRSDLYLDLLSLPWKLQASEEKSVPSPHVRPHKSGSFLQLRYTKACGIPDANGIACEIMPTKGRRRCEAHKGMQMRSASKALNFLVSVHAREEDATEATAVCEPSQLLVCGYLLKDGSKCTVLPEKGRKRCLSHKGRRIKMN